MAGFIFDPPWATEGIPETSRMATAPMMLMVLVYSIVMR
jgi:hypothetical protein